MHAYSSQKMFALIKYVEDSVIHVCSTKDIKQYGHQKLARWCDGQFYLSTIICYNDNRKILEDIRENLVHRSPIVALYSDKQQGDEVSVANMIQHDNSFKRRLMLTAADKTNLVKTCRNKDNNFTETALLNKATQEGVSSSLPSSLTKHSSNCSSEIGLVTDAFTTSPPDSLTTLIPLDPTSPSTYDAENGSVEIISRTRVNISPDIIRFTEENRQYDINTNFSTASMDRLLCHNEPLVIEGKVVDYSNDYFEMNDVDLQDGVIANVSHPVQNTWNLPSDLEDATFINGETNVMDLQDTVIANVSHPVQNTCDVFMDLEDATFINRETNVMDLQDTVIANVSHPVQNTCDVFIDLEDATFINRETNVMDLQDTVIANVSHPVQNTCDVFSDLEDTTFISGETSEGTALKIMSRTSIQTTPVINTLFTAEVDGQCDTNDVHSSPLSTDASVAHVIDDLHNSSSACPVATVSIRSKRNLVQMENPEVQCNKKRKPTPLTYDRNVVITPSHTSNAQVLDNIPATALSENKKTNPRKYFCVYCNKLYAKFPQHLQTSHRDEPAVKMYMFLPSKSPERRKIIETIRRRGDFVHNTSTDFNSGHLFVARRSHSQSDCNSKDYVPCPHCAAFFNKTTLRLHAKHCIPAKVTGQRNILSASRSLLCKLHPRASEFLKTKIFSIFRDDDCVQSIRYDLLAVLYGNYMCNKYSLQHHHDMIRNKLRSIGRLLIVAKSMDSTIKDFVNLLTPEKFDVAIAAIKQVGGLNATNTHYKAPTTVLTLSTVCKQACNIWKTECIKNSDPIAKQKVEDFLVLFNVSFPAELGRTAIENRVEQQRHKVVELPMKDDVKKLVSFLRLKRREWFSKIRRGNVQDFRYALQQLASYTLVSLMVFNRRRPGELERITLTDFANLKSAHTISALGGHFQANPDDARLANRYKRFEIRGKLNRTVPVLVDFEIEACINLIIQNREKLGISSDNPYVFACPSNDGRHKYLRACYLLRTYSNTCGASRSDLLRATFLRKQIATECALNDLADNVIHDVANFMGHAVDIHNNIYRRPVEKRDILQMSKILEMIQGDNNYIHETSASNNEPIMENSENAAYDKEAGSSLQNNEVQQMRISGTADCLENTNFNTETTTSTTHVSSSDSPPHNDHPPRDDSSSDDDCISTTKKKGKHINGLTRVCGPKRSWTPEEIKAASEHFKKYLLSNKLPSLSKICQKLPLITQLKLRSPTSVKTWLHNELVRQRGKRLQDIKTPHDIETPHVKVRRTRWTPNMMFQLKKVFADNFKYRKLPSNSQCAAAKDNFPDFQHLTIAAIKTAVANEMERMKRT
ncbi:uncharacterized protein LOC116171817 [Photinus pyralis]|nr:uncharacterized protein LOC116171817 [Photinus pyralis]XP_031344681.1 uncharacterized protein LOC116171817 [Photinus pyralis]